MVQRKISSGSFASFKEFITGDMVYVDKTAPLCTLAREQGSFLLARPRRMGKSTLVSTLEYLFSKGTEGTEGLACHTQWDDPNRYFVFKFSWNNIRPLSADELERGLLWQLNTYANYFGLELPSNVGLMQQAKYLFTQSLDKLSDQQFMQEHAELFNGDRPLCKTKAVLLIDEYDAPLTYSIEKGKSVDDLVRVYANFFSTIKEIDFRFVLITGVSSYAQTSIFSGANQFANISLQYKYATCCGFTHEELERYFDEELRHAEQVQNLSRDELMHNMTLAYFGHMFSNHHLCQTQVCSPVSVSRFLKEPELGFENYWSDTGAKNEFLLKLLKYCSIGMASNIYRLMNGKLNKDKATRKPSPEESLAGLNMVLTAFVNPNSVVKLDSDVNQNSGVKLDSDVNPNSGVKPDSDVNPNSKPTSDISPFLAVKLKDLTVKIEDLNELTVENAIAILFQSGYLSIRRLEDEKALLGFTNYDVIYTITELMRKYGLSISDSSGLKDN